MSDVQTAFFGTAILMFYAVLGYVRPRFALLTLPFMVFAILCAGIGYERVDYSLFAGVLLVVTLGAVAWSGRDPESQEWFHRWAFWVLVVIAASASVTLFFVGLGMIGAGFVLPLFFFLGIVAMVASIISYGITNRAAMVMHVFSTLGTSMRQNLPLPMALDCAATGRENSLAWTLRRIKKRLVQGYSLAESVRQGYPQCPGRALALLTAAERVGQLPAAIEAIEADAHSRAAERNRLRPVHPLYPVVVLTIMFLLVLGLMTFVMPQYKAVLQEMVQGELPAATQILLRVSGLIAYHYGGLILLVIFLGWLVAGPALWLRGRFCPRRPDRPYRLSQIGDWLKWHLPILHWFEHNRSTLLVVEWLQLCAKAGSPVNEAIRGALELDVNLCYRKRLARWLECVERGDNIAGAARRCKLGTALAWALDEGTGAGDAPTVLAMIEGYYRSNYSYRANLARFILWPCAIIALGVTVGFVVYAIFTPGVAVLETMADYVYP